MARMPDPVIDLRGLEPPEPLLRILEELEERAVSTRVFLLAREPFPLYPLISGMGWRHAVRQDDRGWELTLTRDSRIS